jgi:translocator protein
MNTIISALRLISAILLCEAAGFVGSFFTTPSIASGWYATLNRSALTPPAWVFAPVWTLLFALMGVALFLVLRERTARRATAAETKTAVGAFLVQLAFNVLWSALFFGMHDPASAFAEIIILWLSIVATVVFFWRINRSAAYLLLPYLAWVSFAGYLNFTIWQLN